MLVWNSNNPWVRAKLADIEGGEACLALSSGMAAISTALLSALETGDHLIAGKVIYGCTFTLLIDVFKKIRDWSIVSRYY